jgi:hypothetical protein
MHLHDCRHLATSYAWPGLDPDSPAGDIERISAVLIVVVAVAVLIVGLRGRGTALLALLAAGLGPFVLQYGPVGEFDREGAFAGMPVVIAIFGLLAIAIRRIAAAARCRPMPFAAAVAIGEGEPPSDPAGVVHKPGDRMANERRILLMLAIAAVGCGLGYVAAPLLAPEIDTREGMVWDLILLSSRLARHTSTDRGLETTIGIGPPRGDGRGTLTIDGVPGPGWSLAELRIDRRPDGSIERWRGEMAPRDWGRLEFEYYPASGRLRHRLAGEDEWSDWVRTTPVQPAPRPPN